MIKNLIFIFVVFLILSSSFLSNDIGIFHKENTKYDTFLLSDVSILNKVFNVYENDSLYRGRELSNIFNYLDSKFIEFLIFIKLPKFISIIHYSSLILMSFIIIIYFYKNKNRLLKKNFSIFILLFFLLLLTPSIYHSGILHFRTSKILVGLISFQLYFIILSKRKMSSFTILYFLLLSILMSLVDEQGFAILLFLICCLFPFIFQKRKFKFNILFYITLIALLFRQFYFYKIGPVLNTYVSQSKVSFSITSSEMQTLFNRFLGIDIYYEAINALIDSFSIFFSTNIFVSIIILIISFILLVYRDFLKIFNSKSPFSKNIKKYVYFNPMSYLTFRSLIFLLFLGILLVSIGGRSIKLIYYPIPSAVLYFIFSSYIISSLLTQFNSKNFRIIVVVLLSISAVISSYGIFKNYNISINSFEYLEDFVYSYNETKKLKSCVVNMSLPIKSFHFDSYYLHDINYPTYDHYSFLCDFYRKKIELNRQELLN